ncbi:MAG: UDP-glucose 4-epimerase GalE [Candidatus Babeliales bacterium]|jgi:UDP-glucose 4-epimerase
MTKRTVLVVGGAGYIGSHACWLLHEQGYEVVILDALLHNQKFTHSWAKLIKGDFADQKLLKAIFTNYKIDTVMHFAAFIEVGESVKKPKDFYNNNVTKTLTLLDTMLEYNVKKFIFSSSCAVYGVPQKLPLDEAHPLAPINPYGKNKLTIEFVLQDYHTAYNLNYVSLRYFNAAGAHFEQGLGEQHSPETHVIPLLIRAAMQDKEFFIFGDNYPTHDGTCVRDYVHVLDIAQAHILAYDYLEKHGKSNSFNLGSQNGNTIKELIKQIEQICKKKIKTKYWPRREGDVPILVANSNKAQQELGWEAKLSDLENILKSAYEWELILKKM